MAPENRKTADEAFRELETQLAALRVTSKTLRERRPSRTENLFHPGRRAKEEAEFGAAVVAAMKDFGASIRNALQEQEAKLAELNRQISEVRSEQTELSRLRERQEQLEALAREQAQAVATAARGTAELRQQMEQSIGQVERSIEQIKQSTEQVKQSIGQAEQSIEQAGQSIGQVEQSIRHLEQSGREHGAKAEQLAAGQKDLANEFRERIQHLLDEQRVALRQLALKASEDAILSDRARRATELKLEELAKRVPPGPPA